MGKYQRYPEYALTKTDWLGEAPKHWQTVALGRLFRRIKRIGHADKELLSVYRDYGVIPKSSRDDNNNKPSDDLSPYQLVKPNDLVMNKMKTWQGSIAISEYEGIVSPAYFVYQPLTKLFKVALPKYVHYLLRNPMYIAQYLRRSKGIRVSQWDLDPDEFQRIELLLPNKDEQLQIFQFLDHETTKIDTLIEKQQQLIKLLKEKRQAVISHAVTKGLNPNAPMRDSGVEWLGEVPEHWEVKRVKHFGKIIGGYAFKSGDFLDCGIRAIKIANVSHLSFNWSENSYLPSSFLDVQRDYIVPKGSLIFAMTRPIISGGVKVAKFDLDEECLVNQRVGFLKPSININQDYLMYVAQSKSFFCIFENNCTVTNQPNISAEGIEDIRFACPDLVEQQEVVNYIKHVSSLIGDTITKGEAQVELLKERRSALISAAVTGKIDVRKRE